MSRDPARTMSAEAFERLSKQLALIIDGCSERQVLELADVLHDMIRHRRQQRHGRSFADG